MTMTPTIFEQLEPIIEAEVRRRMNEKLSCIAVRQESVLCDSLPDPDQPHWYGVIRKHFGWQKWKHLHRARKVFLASFGKLLQDKAVERYARHAEPLCYLLERLLAHLSSLRPL